MKKKLSALLAMILILTLFAACGGSGTASSAASSGAAPAPSGSTAPSASDAPAQDVIVLKLGSSMNDGTAEVEGAKRFAELLAEYSGGTMKCDVLANGLAGGEREIVEGQQLGSMDMSIVSGILQNFDPAMMILEYDLLFLSEAHVRKVFEGEIGERIYERLIDTAGIRVLSMYIRTPRLMTTSKKIEGLEDLKGLKLRVPEMAARTSLWTALGASPTPMAFTEVYTALQTSTIDGQENPISAIINSNFYEVCDYLAVTNHVYGFMFINIAEETWQKLNDEQRGWVEKAAAESALYNDQLAKEQEAAQMAIAEENMTLTHPDTSSWRELTKDVYKQFTNVDGFEELYLAIVEAGEEFQ